LPDKPKPSAPETPAPSNPIAEASVGSLDELFSRDPLDLSKADRARIVQALRDQRARWQLDEKAGKTRASAAPKPAKSAGTAKLELKDLGL